MGLCSILRQMQRNIGDALRREPRAMASEDHRCQAPPQIQAEVHACQLPLQMQIERLTASLLESASAFDEDVYKGLNAMFREGYTERNALSERYMADMEDEYYSCPHLQGTVNIDLDGLAICCRTHSRNRGCVRIGKFQGNAFPLALLLAARLKITRDINAGVDTPCTGCVELRKKRWDKPIYPIDSFVINDWTECNLRCKYCYTLQDFSHVIGQEQRHDLLLLLKDALKNHYLALDAHVYWGGGEVTVYPAFEPVARMLLEHQIYQVVNTNAVVFSECIEAGVKANLMEVVVSVDAGTPETFLRIKGRDFFCRVWENISRYARAGTITAKYIICNDNVSPADADGFINLCSANKVASIALVPEQELLIHDGFSDETLRLTAHMIHMAERLGLTLAFMQPFSSKQRARIDEHLKSFIP